jgi:hypothetical protein
MFKCLIFRRETLLVEIVLDASMGLDHWFVCCDPVLKLCQLCNIFTFPPDAKETAQEHIAGLYLFLQKDLTEEDLSKYFVPEEIQRG